MKTKIGTALDHELIRRARLIAAREGKRFNEVLEEALSDHLQRKSTSGPGGVVARTAGSLKSTRRIVNRVLQEEPGIFDR